MSRSTNLKPATMSLLLGALVFTESLMAGGGRAWDGIASNRQLASPERRHRMKISLKVESKVLTASLADNATARDFVSLLPLQLSMNDLFGREKYGDLPRPISENGPRKNRYEVGEIAYWSPGHQVAVYYRQDGEQIPSPGIITVAKIDGDVDIFNVPGPVKVTIGAAK